MRMRAKEMSFSFVEICTYISIDILGGHGYIKSKYEQKIFSFKKHEMRW